MPAANWIEAAKKTPSSPIVVVEIESADAVMIRKNMAMHWNASTSKTAIEVVENADGTTATVRPARYLYHNNDASFTYIDNRAYQNTGYYPEFTTPAVETYLESITANWSGRTECSSSVDSLIATCTVTDPSGVTKSYPATAVKVGAYTWRFDLGKFTNIIPGGFFDLGTDVRVPFPANTVCVPNMAKPSWPLGALPFPYVKWEIVQVDSNGNKFQSLIPSYWIYANNDADYLQTMRAKSGSFYTEAFDLGSEPTAQSIFTCKDAAPGASTVTYTAFTSPDGSSWANVGTVIDGGLLPAARYYRFFVQLDCYCDPQTGALYVPEVSEIKVVGGNTLYEYYSNSVDVTVPGYVVRNHLKSVSGTAAKIDLKGKPTVGDLSFTLNWTREAGAMVIATNRKRAIKAYIGFAGMAWADYEPYFCGLWDSVSLDQVKREITVKVFDVWKLFKKKLPELQISGDKSTISNYLASGNIIDVITDIAEEVGVPGRFVDTAAFTALKAASYTSGWDVSRTFSEQENSDDLLAELAVSAGLFLLPGADGKLRPIHYDTAVAGAPSAALDAARHHFSVSDSDFGETVTQVRVFYGTQLGDDVSKAENFPKCYVNVNVDAEVDRDERKPMEWLDKWRMAVSAADGADNPITMLADRLLHWYCPTRTVDGKTVATAAIKVTTKDLPLSYLGITRPGAIVTVDNLRIPAPVDEWEGFSDGMTFLVMSQKVDSKKWSISIDLRQVGEVSYSTTPNWYTYANDTMPALQNPHLPIFTGDLNATYGMSPTQQTAIIGIVPFEPGCFEPGCFVESVDDLATYDTEQLGFIGNISRVRAVLDGAVADLGSHGTQITGLLADVGLNTADIVTINADIANKTQDLTSLNAAVAGLITNDYDNATAYSVNDYVRYNGIVYRCILASTGNLPTNATYWEEASTILTLMTDIQAEVDTLSGTVATKVSQSSYNTKTGELDAADSAMTQRADQIVSRVDTTTIQLLGGAEWDADRIYATVGFRIHYQGDIYELSQEMVAAHATTPDLDTSFWDLVASPTARLITAESAITQNAADITIHSQTITGPLAFEAGCFEPGCFVESVEDVLGMDVRISQAMIKADSANAQIVLQASALDALTGRLSSAEVTIDGANAAILLRATKDELSGEVEILNNAINLKVDSETILTAGYIDGEPGVGINGAVVVDGSIVARHLTVDSLSALSANLGVVTAGSINIPDTTTATEFVSLGYSNATTGFYSTCNDGRHVARIRQSVMQNPDIVTKDGYWTQITPEGVQWWRTKKTYAQITATTINDKIKGLMIRPSDTDDLLYAAPSGTWKKMSMVNA